MTSVEKVSSIKEPSFDFFSSIICVGWFHSRNLDGIQLLAKTKSLPIFYADDEKEFLSDLNKYFRHSLVLVGNDVFDPPADTTHYYLFGPHIFPHHIKRHTQSVFFNTLCTWVSRKYELVKPSLNLVKIPFPLALPKNEPFSVENRKNVLIYIKNREDTLSFWNPVHKHFKDIFRVFRYGQYVREEYLEYLKTCKYSIFLNGSESQGFAILESFHMGVPAIICDLEYYKENQPYPFILGIDFYKDIKETLEATAVPWFSKNCGAIVKNVDDLENAISYMETNWKTLNPSEEVGKAFSVERFYARLVKLFFKKK